MMAHEQPGAPQWAKPVEPFLESLVSTYSSPHFAPPSPMTSLPLFNAIMQAFSGVPPRLSQQLLVFFGDVVHSPSDGLPAPAGSAALVHAVLRLGCLHLLPRLGPEVLACWSATLGASSAQSFIYLIEAEFPRALTALPAAMEEGAASIAIGEMRAVGGQAGSSDLGMLPVGIPPAPFFALCALRIGLIAALKRLSCSSAESSAAGGQLFNILAASCRLDYNVGPEMSVKIATLAARLVPVSLVVPRQLLNANSAPLGHAGMVPDRPAPPYPMAGGPIHADHPQRMNEVGPADQSTGNSGGRGLSGGLLTAGALPEPSLAVPPPPQLLQSGAVNVDRTGSAAMAPDDGGSVSSHPQPPSPQPGAPSLSAVSTDAALSMVLGPRSSLWRVPPPAFAVGSMATTLQNAGPGVIENLCRQADLASEKGKARRRRDPRAPAADATQLNAAVNTQLQALEGAYSESKGQVAAMATRLSMLADSIAAREKALNARAVALGVDFESLNSSTLVSMKDSKAGSAESGVHSMAIRPGAGASSGVSAPHGVMPGLARRPMAGVIGTRGGPSDYSEGSEHSDSMWDRRVMQPPSMGHPVGPAAVRDSQDSRSGDVSSGQMGFGGSAQQRSPQPLWRSGQQQQPGNFNMGMGMPSHPSQSGGVDLGGDHSVSVGRTGGAQGVYEPDGYNSGGGGYNWSKRPSDAGPSKPLQYQNQGPPMGGPGWGNQGPAPWNRSGWSSEGDSSWSAQQDHEPHDVARGGPLHSGGSRMEQQMMPRGVYHRD